MAQEIGGARRAARLAIVEEHVRAEVAHELDTVVATFGKNAVWNDKGAREDHFGHDGVRSHYAELFEGFPDVSLDIEQRHHSEESVVLEVMIRGTHEGTWKGIPATGKKVEFPVCAIFTFDDQDMIQAEIVYFDRLTVLTQLGVV